MNLSLFFKFLIADKLNKPVKLRDKKLVKYALEMNYIQYIVEKYDSNLNAICEKDLYSLEFEGRKALYTFQTQFIKNISLCKMTVSTHNYSPSIISDFGNSDLMSSIHFSRRLIVSSRDNVKSLLL